MAERGALPQALSGVLPLAPGETEPFKIAFAIQSDAPAPELAEVIAEVGAVSAGVAAFVRRALRKALPERFQSVAEMFTALEAVISMAGLDEGLLSLCLPHSRLYGESL